MRCVWDAPGEACEICEFVMDPIWMMFWVTVKGRKCTVGSSGALRACFDFLQSPMRQQDDVPHDGLLEQVLLSEVDHDLRGQSAVEAQFFSDRIPVHVLLRVSVGKAVEGVQEREPLRADLIDLVAGNFRTPDRRTLRGSLRGSRTTPHHAPLVSLSRRPLRSREAVCRLFAWNNGGGGIRTLERRIRR
jgi:hypothetical protein